VLKVCSVEAKSFRVAFHLNFSDFGSLLAKHVERHSMVAQKIELCSLFVVQARRSQGEAILEVGAIRNAPLS
jgi:hypothetical protein